MKVPFSLFFMITGATSGIGGATAKIFAKNGYQLILTGRRKERLEEVKNKLVKKYGIDIVTLCFDIRDINATKKAYKSLKADWKNPADQPPHGGTASQPAAREARGRVHHRPAAPEFESRRVTLRRQAAT